MAAIAVTTGKSTVAGNERVFVIDVTSSISSGDTMTVPMAQIESIAFSPKSGTATWSLAKSGNVITITCSAPIASGAFITVFGY